MDSIIILGISAYYHDSAAAIIADGKIVAAAQEERFTRKKHDESFPKNAIEFCLKESGISLSQLDAIVFYDKPFLKFERLLETYYQTAPKGIVSFVKSMPIWLKEKLFLKSLLRKELKAINNDKKLIVPLLFSEHHLSHAAGTFFSSPYTDAAIVTIDGVGEWSTASIALGKGNNINILKELHFPDSVGLLYSSFTYFLGFKVNSGEYKMMGLAPYGNENSENYKRFYQIISSKLVKIFPDGSIRINPRFFSYSYALKMVPDKKWETLFGVKRRKPDDKLLQIHCDLALAIQRITEDIVLRLVKNAVEITGLKNICLSGGVALNCVANGKILKTFSNLNLHIQPASGDAGGALGAALAIYHLYFGKPREVWSHAEVLKHVYSGNTIEEKEALSAFRKYKAVYSSLNFEDLTEVVANHLQEGKVVGWIQGKMEFGPRALGNRSILGNPINKDTQKTLNLKIKYRESFRPFAPSIIAEDLPLYFESITHSPFMLLVDEIKAEYRNPLAEDYSSMNIADKLYVVKSSLPAITHVDFSARIQSVHQESNPEFYALLQKFKSKSGFGVLVNTSFNVRGEPIVCSAEDAYKCFMRTEMDALVINNFLLLKSNQPHWTDDTKWEETFTLD
jgi:carbamoyltransferase